jgi:hypothetical protein
MSFESRVNHLLRAAERSEREGNVYIATILRKMAAELGPADWDPPVLTPSISNP